MHRAVVRVVVGHAVGKLVEVGLPQQHSPARQEAICDEGIFLRNEVAQDLRACSGPDSCGVEQVFQGNRDSMKRAAVAGLSNFPLRLPGLPPGQSLGDGYEGIQLRLETVDSFQKKPGQFHR